jgi:penicillin-binding protein 1C
MPISETDEARSVPLENEEGTESRSDHPREPDAPKTIEPQPTIEDTGARVSWRPVDLRPPTSSQDEPLPPIEPDRRGDDTTRMIPVWREPEGAASSPTQRLPAPTQTPGVRTPQEQTAPQRRLPFQGPTPSPGQRSAPGQSSVRGQSPVPGQSSAPGQSPARTQPTRQGPVPWADPRAAGTPQGGSPPSRPPAGGAQQAGPPPSRPVGTGSPPGGSPPDDPRSSKAAAGGRRRLKWANVLLTISMVGVGLFLLALLGSVIGYIALAAQLPPPDELRERQPNFASSQIYDRNGKLLHEIIDPNAGKRTYVPIDQISDHLKNATVATEDRNFYQHGGFDPIAIARAVFYAVQEREIVSGASTITQQVARNILLGPEAGLDRSATRKVKEIILAAELERRYSKDDILEVYLNNNNYGNLAYGIDAAARTYFGTNAAQLTLAQGTFLAGIPQSPAVYNAFTDGRTAALRRHEIVLGLTVDAGYITRAQADAAEAEMKAYEFVPVFTDRMPAPHFVVYVTQWVERNLGTDALYTGRGLRIYTTLDPNLQRIAEAEVTKGVAALDGRNATNAALVALEPSSGHILAMVGSENFYNQKDGQVNVILRCRQPGSAIKPLTFLAAMERGWTPASVLWDLPVRYPDSAGNVYEPRNFDGQFRGPVSIRRALANSLNIPAVKALEFVTVEGLLEMTGRLGAPSLVSPQTLCPDYPHETRPAYGLALTLGGGEMKPIELTAAYATLANGGMRMDTTPIMWIQDQSGTVLVDNRNRQGTQVVKSELAYLTTHILSDRQARCEVFSCPGNLELSDRPVAAKTGSTNDNRDAWVVGYTPDIAAGVWVGNNDNSPMAGVLGSSGAAPIWNAFMRQAHEQIPVHSFPRPAGIVEREICVLSGVEPSSHCRERRTELFLADNLPPRSDHDWIRDVEIDANSGLLANALCRSNVISNVALMLNGVADPDGRNWLTQWAADQGIMLGPTQECTGSEQAPVVEIRAPSPGQEVYGYVEIHGTVEMADFDHYEITFGVSDDPQGWGWVSGPHTTQVRDGTVGVWHLPDEFSPGPYTVRVTAFNTRGAVFEARQTVQVIGPTPTPTPEATPTELPTETPTATPTATPTPIVTPSPEATMPSTATPTPLPATPTAEPELTATPAVAPTETVPSTVAP